MSMSSKKEATTFSGVRSEWPEFKRQLQAKLLSIDAHNIIFPNDNGEFEEFKDMPEDLGPQATQMDFNMWKYRSDLVRDFNKEYRKRETAAFGVIQELLDPRLLDVILATKGDPRAAYLRLEDDYGTKADDIHAISLQKQNFLKMKQKENELFSQFYVGFELQRKKAHCTEEDALALLTNRNKELNPLQKRLHEDAQTCRKDEKSYEQTVRFLSKEDQSNLENGVFKTGVSARRIRRDEDETDGEPQEKTAKNTPAQVPTKTCPCCGNVGHAPRDCKLDACNWCEAWHCGHNSFNCPKRREDSRKGKQSKEKPDAKKGKGRKIVPQNKDEKKSGKGFDSKRKRSGFRIKKSTAGSDDSDDSETVAYEEDEDEEEEELQVRYKCARRVSVRMIGSKKFIKPKGSEFLMRVDTGADVPCAPKIAILQDVTHEFSSTKAQKEHQVHAADGHALKCVAKGDIDEYITDVHVLPELDESLLAVAPLQEKGIWTILPPASAGLRHTCYMVDCEGKIKYAADDNLMVDIRDTYEEYPSVILPEIRDSYATSVRRMGVYGFNATSLNELVSFWHNALGHPSMEKMCAMVDNNVVAGINMTSKQIRAHWIDCIHCIKGKMTKRPIRVTSPKMPISALKVGDVVARDIYVTGALKGPNNLSSFETYVDLKSGFLKPIAVYTKTDVLENTKKITAFYRRHNHDIRVLKSDSESVYKSEKMKSVMDELLIEPQYDPPYTHATLIEIRHRLAGNKVTSMFSAAPHVPHELFFEAVKTFCHTENLFFHPNSEGKSAYELFTGVKPDMAKFPLLPFGAPVEVHVPAEQRHGKFEDKSVSCMYLGIEEGTVGAIRVWNPISKTVLVRNQYTVLPFVPSDWPIYNKAMKGPRRVTADAEVPILEELPEVKVDPVPETEPSPIVSEGVASVPAPVIAPSDQEGEFVAQTEEVHQGDAPLSDQKPHLPAEIVPVPTVDVTVTAVPDAKTTRSGRQVKPPPRFAKIASRRTDDGREIKVNKYQNGAVKSQRREKAAEKSNCVRKVKAKVRTDDNPTFRRATDPSNPDKPRWDKAIAIEDQQMLDEGVFDTKGIADLTEDEKREAIRTHYELVAKRDSEGRIEKYKARLVANGNTQPESTYDDIKSPTARSASVKLAIAIAAKQGYKVRVFDVKGAYLKVKIQDDRRLFVRLPDGRLARLLKYLYGLKQAGLEWHLELKKILIKLGYKQSTADNCVFTYMNNGDYVNIVVHVDDLFCTASSDRLLDSLGRSLTKEFGEVTQKSGETFTYLGMKVRITKNGIYLSQPGAIDKVVEDAELTGCSPAPTPETLITTVVKGGEKPADQTVFRSLVGQINWIACQTRPELLHALSKLAKKSSNPNMHDMHRVKRVIRYLNGTRELGLFFRASGSVKLTCMADASYNSSQDSRGQSGYVFTLGREGDAVFYARSAKQKCVALSSTESEYVTLCDAATEIVWLRQLLKDMGFEQDAPTETFEDNMAAIKIAQGAGTHQRTKHINVKYHFTRQAVTDKVMSILYMPTEDMIADILTKELPRAQFEKLRDAMLQTYY